MAEKERTKELIKQEYFNLCLRNGDLNYQIKRNEEEIVENMDKMKVLDDEMLALHKAQKEMEAAKATQPGADMPKASENTSEQDANLGEVLSNGTV